MNAHRMWAWSSRTSTSKECLNRIYFGSTAQWAHYGIGTSSEFHCGYSRVCWRCETSVQDGFRKRDMELLLDGGGRWQTPLFLSSALGSLRPTRPDTTSSLCRRRLREYSANASSMVGLTRCQCSTNDAVSWVEVWRGELSSVVVLFHCYVDTLNHTSLDHSFETSTTNSVQWVSLCDLILVTRKDQGTTQTSLQ